MSGWASTNLYTSLVDLDFFNIQGIPCFDYKNLTIDEGGSISVDEYRLRDNNGSGKAGGILCIRVSDTLTFNGGHINLVDKGISQEYKDYRPLTSWEKGETSPPGLSRLPLSVGDGMCIIFAKNVVFTSNASRLGNINENGSGITKRNPYETSGLTQMTTNIGGSTVIIIAETVSGYDPSCISCFRTKLENDTNEYKGVSFSKIINV